MDIKQRIAIFSVFVLIIIFTAGCKENEKEEKETSSVPAQPVVSDSAEPEKNLSKPENEQPPAAGEDILGEWIGYWETGSERLIFEEDGHYTQISEDSTRESFNYTDEGTWEIKDGMLYIMYAGEKETPYKEVEEYAIVNEKLVLIPKNTYRGFVYVRENSKDAKEWQAKYKKSEE